jgi:4-hydroxy-tetrahydrodipicolinate synthase
MERGGTVMSGKLLSGIIPPVPTPLTADEQVDPAGVSNLVDYLITAGVHGIFVLGTMGEFASLEEDEKERLVALTVQAVRKRVPVFAGVGDTGTRRAAAAVRRLARYDVDAITVLLPFYFMERREEEHRLFLTEILRVARAPVVFYENPHTTKRTFSMDDFRWLGTQRQVIGIKDSSSNLPRMKDLIAIYRERAEFGIVTGAMEDIEEATKLGADGAIPGIGALVPDLCLRMYRSSVAGDWDHLRQLRGKYLSVMQIYQDRPEGNSRRLWPGALKTALKCLGIMDDHVASPHLRLSAEEAAHVRRVLVAEGVLQA